MSTVETRYRHTLTDQIRDAAALLTEPVEHHQPRDDGTTTTHAGGSLLDQLAAEAIPSSPRRGGRGHPSGAPVAIEVLDLHHSIRLEAAAWCWRLTNHTPPDDVPERIRRVAAAAGDCTDLDTIRHLHRALIDWINGIRSVLEPPRRMELMRPCPACETTTIYRQDPTTGETVRRHALEVDGTTGADCLACAAHWPVEQLEHLALVIGCDPVSA